MSDEIRGLIDYIYMAENGGRIDHNVVYGGIPRHLRPSKPLTEMTVGEVHDWQRSIRGKVASTAAGALQVIYPTLTSLLKKGVVSRDEPFNADTQDRMTIALMQGRGLDAWQSGRMSTEQFGTNLAKEWASLPVLMNTRNSKGQPIQPGHAYYGGVATNPHRSKQSHTGFAAQLGEPGRTLVPPGSPGMTDPAGGRPAPGVGKRLARQAGPGMEAGDPYRHMKPWEKPEARLSERWSERSAPSDSSSFGLPDLPDHVSVYNTPVGAGGGGVVHPGWGRAFADEFTDSFIVRGITEGLEARKHKFDFNFDPVEQAVEDGFKDQWQYLGRARDPQHYQELVRNIEREQLRNRRRDVWDGTAAATLGGILNPDTLISVGLPGGIVASYGRRAMLKGAGRSAGAAAGIAASYEIPAEHTRSRLDPFATELDSIVRVGGATVFSGLIGGAIGATISRQAQRNLVKQVSDEILAESGYGAMTRVVKLGDRGEARVVYTDGGSPLLADMGSGASRGVRIVGDRIEVSEPVILSRFMGGKHGTDAITPNELVEYEIGRAVGFREAMARFMKGEHGGVGPRQTTHASTVNDAGEIEVHRDLIQHALDEGNDLLLGPAAKSPQFGRIEPIRVDPRKLGTVDQIEQLVRDASAIAARSRDTTEFVNNMNAHLSNKGFQRVENIEPDDIVGARAEAASEAEARGQEALEAYRRENNRILSDAKLEALGRLMDSPFKRLHRNSFSPEVRDLADRLAADGAFLRKSDETGLTVGASVYSRAKTWDGVVRRLYDKETELYESYLGFRQNPQFADVPLNKSFKKHRADGERAITVDEFRDRVTKAHITRQNDEIGEVNEMVQHLRAAYDEYKAVAEEYGVISSAKELATRREHLRNRIANVRNEELRTEMQVQLDELEAEAAVAKTEPGEDYFTRVFNQRAIKENREDFKRNVVMPWMMQQPYVDVWVIGKDELQAAMKDLEDAGVPTNDPRYEALEKRWWNAPEGKSRMERKAAQTDAQAVQKRADELIDTILEEAEPEDMTTLRVPHRPTFGRHRQFNIPNAMLLKDGPKGNGIADFIETDYLLVQKIYADRMGPAIEMARSFARPADGVNAQQGFEATMWEARDAELRRWSRANPNGTPADFADHWEPMRRDLLHLRDRVTNRVVRDPSRWDNRAATALRNWSHLAFMGMSALPAVQELGTLMMRHGVNKVWRGAIFDLDEAMRPARQAGIEEMRKAGAILDVQMGGALSRFAETGFDSTTGTAVERWLRTNANRYFLLNGLAPLTARLKEMDASLRVSDMLERIDRVHMGVPRDGDLAELARWGLSKDDAIAIRQQPMEQIEEGAWIANTDMWGDEALVRKFRAAIRQGNENTILAATAADKPTIVDGVVYLRSNPRLDKHAIKAGWEKQGDYWRIQSGMLSLPFTFWNYAIAATNKILIAGVDEPSAQKLGGIAALIGLGYMVSALRTNDAAWNEMSLEDRMARAIDQSGVTGVLSQYSHLLQGTAIGLTGRNPMPFDPRHGHDPSAVDAMFNLAGAGPSVARNAVEGIATGDVNRASWALPFRNHFAVKGLFDSAVDGIEARYAGLD